MLLKTVFRSHRFGHLLIFLLALVLVSGCSSDKSARKEPFLDQWRTLAQEAQGRSPSPRSRIIIEPEVKKAEGAGEGGKLEGTAKNLPTERVTLRMRQADAKSVIRALAGIAGINILLKNDLKGDINVDYNEVPWDQAFTSILKAQGLTYVWEGDIIRIVSLDDMEQLLKISAVQEKHKALAMESRRVEPLATMVVNLAYADPEGLRENLQNFLTKEKDGKGVYGSIQVDKNTNSLIIQAIRDDLERIIPIIEKLDKPTPQIHIKANIVETTQETARSLGIQWGGMYGRNIGDHSFYVTPGGNTGTGALPTAPGSYTPAGGAGISGQGFGVNFPASGMDAAASASLGLMFGTIGGNILDIQLSAMQKDSKLNILSSPSITTLDNQKAFTENGEKIPFVTTEVGATGTATKSVKFEDAVLRLEITPHVIDGKTLKMKIMVRKDEVDFSRKVGDNPVIVKKQTETTLIVADGETIVISGLSKQRNTGGESGVPGLKDVPALGWLFKGEQNDSQMQEVLIFITPRILPTQAAADAAARDKQP